MRGARSDANCVDLLAGVKAAAYYIYNIALQAEGNLFIKTFVVLDRASGLSD